VAVETALARGAESGSDLRAHAEVKLLGRDELRTLAPGFAWNVYLGTLGTPPVESLLVTSTDYFAALQTVVAGNSLESLKGYLRWQLVHAAAPLLPRAFVAESFAFFHQTLEGTRQPPPRWRRCVTATDADLGDALGRAFVEQAMPAESKARIVRMVDNLEQALATDITTGTWMTDRTKRRALVKLRAIRNRVGYPDVWSDDSALAVVRGDALGNRQRARAFALRREIATVGHAPDRDEWPLTTPTVNASYLPLGNEVDFPAGILQPPFFDARRDAAANYGAIGSMMGHELTHGFDDIGRRFAADGSQSDWWSAEDSAEFDRRASCLADQYSTYTTADGMHVDGRRTLTENLADAGGVRISYMAWRSTAEGRKETVLDGFTPDQRFFLAFAQSYCSKSAPELARQLVQIDSHAPDRVRVVGALADMPEFARAWSCPASAPMVRQNPCRVW
jgi:putative endopeptidase